MNLEHQVYITKDETVSPARSAKDVFNMLVSNGTYTKDGVTITYDPLTTQYFIEADMDVGPATPSAIGLVKPDGSTLSVDANGTISYNGTLLYARFTQATGALELSTTPFAE